MGRCVVILEQRGLSDNVGGIFIVSHDMNLNYFRLHIVINKELCGKTSLDERILEKITAIHEFTHTIAALSAISRVRSDELITRLKDIFRKKAHALYLTDIEHLAKELSNPLEKKKNIKSEKTANTQYFPDEHFRLGFEDFPISYPIVFDEFLFSREMFEEYVSKEIISSLYEALRKRDDNDLINTLLPVIKRIVQEKALDIYFVARRVVNILASDYIKIYYQ
jgi:hypothetical protein